MEGSQEQTQLNEGNKQGDEGNGKRNWHAARPLERNLKSLGDEGASLLGENDEENEDCENAHVRASEAEDSAPEWSANKDYEGLSWWRRPSVSEIQFFFLHPTIAPLVRISASSPHN